MDITSVTQTAIPVLTQFGLKVLGAIVLWVVARRIIHFVVRLLVRSLKYPFDQTVAGYIGTAASVLLNIALILGILGFFGVETTSLAALMAGVGIAIGAAWSGLLANLAAGVFILILRPFKTGDFISAAGVIGTVDEIGLFVTTITTMDNVRTFVGNGKLFSGEHEDAVRAYKEALDIYPGYVAGYRGLGLAYEQLGRTSEAIAAYKVYVRAVPGAKDAGIIRKRLKALK